MYNRKALKQKAKQCLKATKPHFMLVTLVYYLVTVGLNDLLTALGDEGGVLSGVVYFFLFILLMMFILVMGVGLSNYALRVSRGEPATMGTLFEPFAYAGRAIGTNLLVGLFSFLWACLGVFVYVMLLVVLFLLGDSLLPLVVVMVIVLYIALIVFCVWISLRYIMASYALAERPEAGVMDAIRRSIRMMRGYKGKFFMLCLSFLGWTLLSALIIAVVMGIGVFATGMEVAFMDAMAMDPVAASAATEQITESMMLWIILAEVLSLPLVVWLIGYQSTSYALFFNYVSGYDHQCSVADEAVVADEIPVAAVVAAEQPVTPPEGGYYTAPNAPQQSEAPVQPEDEANVTAEEMPAQEAAEAEDDEALAPEEGEEPDSDEEEI